MPEWENPSDSSLPPYEEFSLESIIDNRPPPPDFSQHQDDLFYSPPSPQTNRYDQSQAQSVPDNGLYDVQNIQYYKPNIPTLLDLSWLTGNDDVPFSKSFNHLSNYDSSPNRADDQVKENHRLDSINMFTKLLNTELQAYMRGTGFYDASFPGSNKLKKEMIEKRSTIVASSLTSAGLGDTVGKLVDQDTLNTLNDIEKTMRDKNHSSCLIYTTTPKNDPNVPDLKIYYKHTGQSDFNRSVRNQTLKFIIDNSSNLEGGISNSGRMIVDISRNQNLVRKADSKWISTYHVTKQKVYDDLVSCEPWWFNR